MRALLVAIVALVATLPGLWALPPVDRDEARFVQATKQMLETGDYVDIRFQEQSRYKKPVGIYWLQAAAVKATGHGADAPIWAYRLVSVLGIVLAALATYWTGRKLFGETAGLIAAVALAATFGCAFEGRIGKTDAMLLGLSIVAQGALAQLYVASRRGETANARLPWLFWGAQGAAILIKGPIVPLLSLLTVVALVVADRQWRWLKTLRPLSGLLLAVAIVLPWLAAITWKAGAAFWQESVGNDMFGKIGQGAESHWGPPGYYVLTYSLYMWPFGLLAIGAGLLALRWGRSDPRVRFCIAWYLPFWLVLEAVSTKLPHYVLPAYPALMLLLGWAATEGRALAAQAAPRLWERLLWYATAAGLIVVTLGLAVIAVGAPLYLDGRFVIWGVPAAIAILAAGWFALMPQDRMTGRRFGLAAACAIAAHAMLFWLVVPSIQAMWLSPRIVAALDANRPCPTTVLASDVFHEPSLVFLAGTSTVLGDAGMAATHLLDDPACAVSLVPAEDRDAVSKLVAAAGRELQPLSEIAGFNYSSGDPMALTLYRIKP